MPPKLKKPLWRRIARAFLVALTSLVVLAVAAVAFVHTSWCKDLVRQRIEAQLAASVAGKARVGSIDYTFLFGEIRAGDVEITDARGLPAIGVARIDVRLDRSSLLSSSPRIDLLAVHGLALLVVHAPDGRSSFDGLFRFSNDKPSLERLSIGRLVVDGKATVVTPASTTIAVTDLALDASMDVRPLRDEIVATISRLAGKVSVAEPGQPARQLDVGVGSVAFARHAAAIELHATGVEAGPLAVASANALVHLDGARLAGQQLVSLQGARLDRAELAALLGRELLADDIAMDVTLSGPPERLIVDGSIRAGLARIDIDGTADVAAARPRYDVTLTGAGLRPTAVVPPLELPDVAGDLRVELHGSGTEPGDREASLDVALRVPGVDLTAKGVLARDESMHGSVDLRAARDELIATLAAAGIVVPAEVERVKAQLPSRLDLALTTAGQLDGAVAVELAPTKLDLANGTVGLEGRVVLDGQELRSAAVRVKLSSLDLRSLARLTGRSASMDSTGGAAPRPTGGAGGAPTPRALGFASIDGTLSGTLVLGMQGNARRADYDLSIALVDPALTVVARGSVDPSRATADAKISTKSRRIASIQALLPLTTRGGTIVVNPHAAWKLDLDLARSQARELAALLAPEARSQLPNGDVALHVALAGSPARPAGTLTLSAATGDRRLELYGMLASSATELSLATKANLAVAGSPLAVLDGTVTTPSPGGGALDLDSLRAQATVDATLKLPARSAASLATLLGLRAPGGPLDGTVSAHITAKGALHDPTVAATLRWAGYRTAARTLGATELVASGTRAGVGAELRHNGGLIVRATADARDPDRIAVSANVHAPGSPLLPLLPARFAPPATIVDAGRLRGDLSGTFTLVRGAPITIEDVDVTGSLGVSGASFAISGSDRRYRDIGLAVTAEPHGLRIAAEAHERDLEKRDRRLEATGRLAFMDRRAATLDLSLVARDWLVFGANFGSADTPYATADANLAVAVDFTKPVLDVDATVHQLALRAPTRDITRFPEPWTGDIVYLAPGQAAGQLPVAALPLPHASSLPRPIDLRVHIPKPVRFVQDAMDVSPRGDLTVRMRDAGVTITGELTMDRGRLHLFGKDLDLVAGKVTFPASHPGGWMDLTFEGQLPDAVMRELTKADSTARPRTLLVGPLANPSLTFAGASNAEFLDVVSMSTLGHGRQVARPGLPASQSVQVPRGVQLYMMSYFATVLPHLLFLDRITAWSDPADGAYGRIQHVEAERYTNGDRDRIRGVVRPRAPGRSTAELQYDRMLLHDDSAAIGVGVRAGDRIGGGLGLFFEWSSTH